MSLLQFACPHCTNLFQTDDASLGKEVACPTCGSVVLLPGPGAEPLRSENSESAPDLTIACPHCEGKFLLPAELVGKPIACPHCTRSVEMADPQISRRQPPPPPPAPSQIGTLPAKREVTSEIVVQPKVVIDPKPKIKKIAGSAGPGSASQSSAGQGNTGQGNTGQGNTDRKGQVAADSAVQAGNFAPELNVEQVGSAQSVRKGNVSTRSPDQIRRNFKPWKNAIVFGLCLLILIATLYFML